MLNCLDCVLDLATTLPAVSSDTDAVYLYGLDILAQQEAERLYYMHDGLGSVRQLVDTTGQVETNYAYDPFGVPVVGGDGSNPYQFTGEAWDAEVGLLYLRARYYQPEVGRFITKDPWAGDVRQPDTLLGTYAYVGNNPATFVDPTGMWRHARTGSIYHTRIEGHYEISVLNPNVQLEYRIPGTPLRRPDMFNSWTGDVYEIEPHFAILAGQRQVREYVEYLNAAAKAGKLVGAYGGVWRFNWNDTTFHMGLGGDWPGRYCQPHPGFPDVNIVADYDIKDKGVVLFWLEPTLRGLVKVAVGAGASIVVPNMRLLKPPNWMPGLQRGRQPAYAVTVQQACGYSLMAGGVVLIVGALAETILTGGGGVWNDVVAVPAGVYLINWGQRLAVQVPVSEVPGETWWQE